MSSGKEEQAASSPASLQPTSAAAAAESDADASAAEAAAAAAATAALAVQAPMDPNDPIWYYIDSRFGKQRGPVNETELLYLICSSGINTQTYGWREGMKEWAQLSVLPELQRVFTAAAEAEEKDASWFYIDGNTVKQGPFDKEMLLQMRRAHQIKDHTPVWNINMGTSGWLPFVEVKELAAAHEEAMSAAETAAAAAAGAGAAAAGGAGGKGKKPRADGKGAAGAAAGAGGGVHGAAATTGAVAGPKAAAAKPSSTAATHATSSSSSSSASSSSSSASAAQPAREDTEGESDAEGEQKKGGSGGAGAGSGQQQQQQPLTEEELKRRAANREKRKRKKEAFRPNEHHTNVYFSGVPSDVTLDEAHSFFKKAGIIKEDPETGLWKIKFYTLPDGGGRKGDGIVSYLREESIELAERYLDGEEIRPGCKVSVQKAVFTKKEGVVVKKARAGGAAAAGGAGGLVAGKPSIAQQAQKQALSWNEDVDEVEGMRIVVLKHMFTLQEVEEAANEAAGEETNPEKRKQLREEGAKAFYEDLRTEIAAECEQKCGAIHRFELFEGNPLGVVSIKFKGPAGAQKCIELMHNRFFGGRKISCEYYDNKSDYRVRESEESEEQRLKAFGDWLEGGGGGGGEN